MSILSTDNKLISIGADYSAGSGINITDHTISVVESAMGETYSAGDNIDIYEQDDQLYISGKDWSDEIDDASANSYTQSTSYFNDWINGQYTGDISNITNNITALSGDLDNVYKKTETSSKDEISDAIQYVSAHAVGDVEVNNYVHNNSATINEVNSSYQENSGNFLTAHQSLEGYATEDWVSAQGYLTGVNLPESATWNETSNIVSSNSAQWDEGKTYTGISPIVVNNDENKISANTYTLSAGVNIAFVEDSANNITRIDCTTQPQDLSYISGQVDKNKQNVEMLSGNVMAMGSTLVSNSAWWNDTASVVQSNSSQWAEGSELPTSASEAIQYVENNSATIDEVNTAVQSSSAQWNEGKTYTGVSPIVVNNDEDMISAATYTLSAGDNISFTEDSANNITRIDCEIPNTYLQNTDLTIVDNKVTEISGIPLSAGDELPSGTMNTSGLEFDNTEISGYSGSAFKDVSLTDVVSSNSGAWDAISTKLDTSAFSDVSGSFLTAHQDLSDYQTTAEMTAYQLVGDYLSATESANYLLTSDSANFYTTANSSGFITSADLTGKADTSGVVEYVNKPTAATAQVRASYGDLNIPSNLYVSGNVANHFDITPVTVFGYFGGKPYFQLNPGGITASGLSANDGGLTANSLSSHTGNNGFDSSGAYHRLKVNGKSACISGSNSPYSFNLSTNGVDVNWGDGFANFNNTGLSFSGDGSKFNITTLSGSNRAPGIYMTGANEAIRLEINDSACRMLSGGSALWDAFVANTISAYSQNTPLFICPGTLTTWPNMSASAPYMYSDNLGTLTWKFAPANYEVVASWTGISTKNVGITAKSADIIASGISLTGLHDAIHISMIGGDSATSAISAINGSAIAVDTSNFLTVDDSSAFYTTANESGFITGVDLTPYQTIADMTAYQVAGDYYSSTNPSGFITSEDIASKLDSSAFTSYTASIIPAQLVATSAEATGTNILYVVTGE